jgi:hypothetical protein
LKLFGDENRQLIRIEICHNARFDSRVPRCYFFSKVTNNQMQAGKTFI